MLFRFPHTSLNIKIQLILQDIIFQHAPLYQIHQCLVSAFFQIQFFFQDLFFRFRCHPGMLDRKPAQIPDSLKKSPESRNLIFNPLTIFQKCQISGYHTAFIIFRHHPIVFFFHTGLLHTLKNRLQFFSQALDMISFPALCHSKPADGFRIIKAYDLLRILLFIESTRETIHHFCGAFFLFHPVISHIFPPIFCDHK